MRHPKLILVIIAAAVFSFSLYAQDFSRPLVVQDDRLQGEDVQLLQEHLLSLGYDELGIVDGYYGPLTSSAVESFCRVNNIEWKPDSGVDRELWDRIFSPEAVARYDQELSIPAGLNWCIDRIAAAFEFFQLGSFQLDTVSTVPFTDISTTVENVPALRRTSPSLQLIAEPFIGYVITPTSNGVYEVVGRDADVILQVETAQGKLIYRDFSGPSGGVIDADWSKDNSLYYIGYEVTGEKSVGISITRLDFNFSNKSVRRMIYRYPEGLALPVFRRSQLSYFHFRSDLFQLD